MQGGATIEAGRPACIWLTAPEPIPENTELTLWLRGPKTYRGVIAEREAPTKNIEARFAVRIAGEYKLLVEDKAKHTLLSDRVTVNPGPAHTASGSLVAAEASTDGRMQLLQAADAHGNKHSAGGVVFEAAINGVGRCTVTDEGDGTYRIRLPLSAPTGPHQLRVWQPAVGNPPPVEHVVELPVYLRRPAEKPPVRATCTLAAGAICRVDEPLHFAIALFDEHGAPASATNPAVAFRAVLGDDPIELRPGAAAATWRPSGQGVAHQIVSPPTAPSSPPASAAASPAKGDSASAAARGMLQGKVVPSKAGRFELCFYMLPSDRQAAERVATPRGGQAVAPLPAAAKLMASAIIVVSDQSPDCCPRLPSTPIDCHCVEGCLLRSFAVPFSVAARAVESSRTALAALWTSCTCPICHAMHMHMHMDMPCTCTQNPACASPLDPV